MIFDVGGVVFNAHNNDGTYLWLSTILDDLGLTKEHLDKIFCEKWSDLVRGKIETIDYLEDVFKDPDFHELNITPEIFINYWLEKDHHPNQSMLEFIKSLDNPYYLGTNQEKQRTNHIIKTVGEHFDGCFSSCQIGFMKPETGFFEYIQNELALSPHDLILIDDTAKNIEAAKKCGWHTYHYQDDLENLKTFIYDKKDTQ
jgi:putative hydrolase of the HAD superfamily